MNEDLTILDSYRAMYAFLDNYYFRSEKPGDLAVLLGAMELSTEPNPAEFTIESQGFEPLDRGVWEDWLDATTIVKSKKNLSVLEAYTAMYRLVRAWYEQGGKSEEPFGILLNSMTLYRNGKSLDVAEWLPEGGEPLDSAMWGEWLDAIKSVTSESRDQKD